MGEEIAGQLKELPRSTRDYLRGDLRIREIAGWDVMFVIAPDQEKWVVTIAGVGPAGELESRLSYLWHCVLEGLPPAVRMMLKGRRKK